MIQNPLKKPEREALPTNIHQHYGVYRDLFRCLSLYSFTQPVDDWARIEIHANGLNLTIYNVKPVDHGQSAKWRLHVE